MLPPTIMQMTDAQRLEGGWTGVFSRRVGRDIEYVALVEGKRVGRPEKSIGRAVNCIVRTGHWIVRMCVIVLNPKRSHNNDHA